MRLEAASHLCPLKFRPPLSVADWVPLNLGVSLFCRAVHAYARGKIAAQVSFGARPAILDTCGKRSYFVREETVNTGG
jgi:hypothetical protein